MAGDAVDGVAWRDCPQDIPSCYNIPYMEYAKKMLLVGNWKMNPRNVEEAKALLEAVKKQSKSSARVDVVVAPPVVYVAEARRTLGTRFLLGAQDISDEKMGAFTGEVGASMLESVGVSHVIIGHSERRAKGEKDDVIEKKVASVLKSNMTVVLCVGERERDTHGKYFSFVEEQVRLALRGVSGGKLSQVVIAYEPIWAISTSSPGARPATPEDAHEMILFIRKVLSDLYMRASAEKVRILYGGSVDQKNIQALLEGSGAQGFLVGGASLRAADFSSIIKAIHAF